MESEPQEVRIDETSPTIQTHLGIIQGVIQRMATNSASCKTWCITIVAAILVVVADKNKPHLAWLTIVPTLLFGGLDIYYLSLEKGFRKSYNDFVKKLHGKTLTASDLYSLEPSGETLELQWKAMKSFSIWGFYLPLMLLIAIAVVIVVR